MKIALLQLKVLEKNREGNIAHGLQLAAAAAKEHELLVLPEVWTTGYSLGHLERDAEQYGSSEVIEALQQIAVREQCAIIAGSVPMRRDGIVYNTSVAINKEGMLINLYDKVHLFGLFNEEKFFAAGNNFNVFDLDGLCCGSTICYDLRFPELFRHLALAGAKWFSVLLNGPRPAVISGVCYYKHELPKTIFSLLVSTVPALLRVHRFMVIPW